MAVVNGTVHSVETIRAANIDPMQFAAVYFTMAGTYAQADNGLLVGVAALIAASRRNGKTITLRTASLWQLARKTSNPALLMGLKTVAIASADVSFEVTEAATANTVELSTELANGAVPEQSVPFGILVGFTEA
jgi:hypothetical protein